MKLYATVLPYLLLISFYTYDFDRFAEIHYSAINESAYHGLTIPLINAYDIKQPTDSELTVYADRHERFAKKDVWPWLFLNRFVGNKGEAPEVAVSDRGVVEPFTLIAGMDLNNTTGAMDAFKKLYTDALKLARQTRSPGVVIDPEPYNNRNAYHLNYLATQHNMSKKEVAQKLEQYGAELAAIAHNTYPEATIWFTFSNLWLYLKSADQPADQPGDQTSITHIVLGMLKRSKAHGYSLKIVSGGQTSLRYCSESAAHLKTKITKRNEDYKPLSGNYPALALGGTITLWDKPENKKAWLLEKPDCLASDAKYLCDFFPYLKELFTSYDHMFIYAATASGYNPFNKEIGNIYNPLLQSSLDYRAAASQERQIELKIRK
ncbi:MAG: hypothetical protein VR64_11575 [Desulfatitalea sp. BRH_c12]|nr:MAG: hypothetical protein VR64_11575 [Desulfatitalea sp. BRH_c12]